MDQDFRWYVQVDVYQDRSHGKDIPLERITTMQYSIASNQALSMAEALEAIIEQERGE